MQENGACVASVAGKLPATAGWQPALPIRSRCHAVPINDMNHLSVVHFDKIVPS
jgi:hypothetical protein